MGLGISYDPNKNFLYSSNHLLSLVNILNPPSLYYFFQNFSFALADARSSNFSFTYQPATKPIIKPIVKNIWASFYCASTGAGDPDHRAHANMITTIAAPIHTFLFFIKSFIMNLPYYNLYLFRLSV